jgi:hypothetical protein
MSMAGRNKAARPFLPAALTIMSDKDAWYSFSAPIGKEWINPCVEVPEAVSLALGGRGFIPVAGTLNGFPIRATLVPLGQGRHRLFINGVMRQAAGVAVGDVVTLSLHFDPEPRDIDLPDDLAQALSESGAEGGFARLPPSRRKELLLYLLDAKRPETRARRVKQIIATILR